MFTTAAVVLAAVVQVCLGVNYTDLVALKLNCKPWDSCDGESQQQPLPEWQVRNCRCDELCDKYADCCLDSQYYDAESQRVNLAQHTCVSQEDSPDVYMKGTCMDDWDDEEVAQLCDAGSLSLTSGSLNLGSGSMNLESGSLSLESGGGGMRADPLSSLPATSLHSTHTYTNYYCAICNNDTQALRLWKARYACKSLPITKLTIEVFENNLLYQNDTWGLLLKDNGTTEFHPCSIVPVVPEDAKRWIRKCSQAVSTCADDWDDDDVADQCQSYTAVVYNLTVPFRNPHCALCNHVRYGEFSCNVLTYSLAPRLKPRTSFALLLDFTDTSGGNLVGFTSACEATEVWDPFFRKCRSIVCARPNEVYRYGKCEVDEDLDAATSEDPTTLPTTTPTPTDTPTLAPYETSNVTDKNRPIIFPQTNTTTSGSVPGTQTTPTLTSTAVSANASAEFLECYKVLLKDEEIVVYENGTVFVEEYGRRYEVYEYEEVDGGVLVCWPHAPTQNSRLQWVGCLWQAWGSPASASCSTSPPSSSHRASGISLGRNLSCLSVALLAAYMTFLASVVTQPGHTACFVLAAAMYYFFLSSFAWMNAISFDIWYTFRKTKHELRVTTGKKWHRFLAYCLYGWIMPAAFMGLVVLVDLVEPAGMPEDLLPRLGQSWCWFAHRKALLIFFAIPMVIILVANSAFFISSATIITQSTLVTPSAVDSGHHKGQYKMYLRLAVLMGFTWITGIVAGYLQLEAVWYLFVVLNTLQGVFIFLAFTCRTKVWRSLGDRCCLLGQRGMSWVAHRTPPLDNQILELSQTPDNTSSTPSVSLVQ